MKTYHVDSQDTVTDAKRKNGN